MNRRHRRDVATVRQRQVDAADAVQIGKVAARDEAGARGIASAPRNSAGTLNQPRIARRRSRLARGHSVCVS